MMKYPLVILLFTGTSLYSAIAWSQPTPKDVDATVVNDVNNPVPVEIQSEVFTTQRVPIAESGEWQGAGLTIPSMILHDMTFYNNVSQVCAFSVNFVIDNNNSRRLYRVDLQPNETREFNFVAGIDTANLRFGTITPAGGDPNACIFHWSAMGYAIE